MGGALVVHRISRSEVGRQLYILHCTVCLIVVDFSSHGFISIEGSIKSVLTLLENRILLSSCGGNNYW